MLLSSGLFSQPGPDITHIICVAQFLASFRSLVWVSGKPSLATLFSTATPTLQNYFSPSLLYFAIQHIAILETWPICPMKVSISFVSTLPYPQHLQQSLATQWNALNSCWTGEWTMLNVMQRSITTQVMSSAYHLSGIVSFLNFGCEWGRGDWVSSPLALQLTRIWFLSLPSTKAAAATTTRDFHVKPSGVFALASGITVRLEFWFCHVVLPRICKI